MSVLARAGLAITRWTERWVPDSWVIAVFLTLVVAGLAIGAGGASPAVALDAWGRGLWALLALAMQFTLMMVVSYACAVSPPVKRLFEWMASRPDPERPRQAILLMGLFSTVTAWLNWAFSLVVCAAFLPFIVRANPRADFRLLVTCAYLGLGTVWHTGLSGSAPLIIATPDNFLIKSGVLQELIPTTRTMFSLFNVGYALVAGCIGLIIIALLVPPADAALTVSDEQTARLMTAHTGKARPTMMIPAERLAAEQARMKPLAILPAEYGLLFPVQVGPTAMVEFQGIRYAMPAGACGIPATLHLYPDRVRISTAGGRFESTHPRFPQLGRTSYLAGQRAGQLAAVAGARKRLYFMRERILELGPVGEGYLTELIHARPFTWKADVEALFALLEEVGDGRFLKLLQRALFQRLYGAEYIVRMAAEVAS